MSKKSGSGDAFEALRNSLERVGEGLKTVREKLASEVAPGVDRARLWADFSQAVSPLLEASPTGTLSGEEIESALADEGDTSDAALEARKLKAAFVNTYGGESWTECIRSSGTLRIERMGGKTRITKLRG